MAKKEVESVKELKLSESVRVKALDGAKYMTVGKEYTVHSSVAERLIAKKQAVKAE